MMRREFFWRRGRALNGQAKNESGFDRKASNSSDLSAAMFKIRKTFLLQMSSQKFRPVIFSCEGGCDFLDDVQKPSPQKKPT